MRYVIKKKEWMRRCEKYVRYNNVLSSEGVEKRDVVQ